MPDSTIIRSEEAAERLKEIRERWMPVILRHRSLGGFEETNEEAVEITHEFHLVVSRANQLVAGFNSQTDADAFVHVAEDLEFIFNFLQDKKQLSSNEGSS